MRNLIAQTGKVMAGFIAFDGYRRAVANDNKATETDKMISDTVNKYEKITKVLQQKEDVINTHNEKTTAILGRLEEKLTLLNKDLNKINLHSDT